MTNIQGAPDYSYETELKAIVLDIKFIVDNNLENGSTFLLQAISGGG